MASLVPLRSRDTKRLTMGRLMRWVARMRARGHQKLSIFLMVASPCRAERGHVLETSFIITKHAKTKKQKVSTYPHVKPAGVRDVVVDVAVVTHPDDAETNQSTHIQRKYRDE